MPRPALTTDEITAFRSRLASVATRLFAERGYEGVTLRAVASELGVSPMTPYRYVRDKAELLTLVRTEAFRRFADGQEAAAAGESDPIERLRRLARAYVAFATGEPDAYRMMFELAQPSTASAELASESMRAIAPLQSAAAEAVSRGELEGDPLSSAHLLWATTHGLVSLHLAGKLELGRTLEPLVSDFLASLARPRREP